MSATVERIEAEPIWFIDNLAYVHVDGRETKGAFGLCELVGAKGNMPPLHVHRDDDETFYVLEGQTTFFVGDRVIEVAAGEAVFAPRGIPHTYRVESGVGRHLVVGSPAGFERFLQEAGERAPREELPPAGRPHDPAALGAMAARYGIEILGPPGALPLT
jgi:quercetin dioxygenase-like cupin family protein